MVGLLGLHLRGVISTPLSGQLAGDSALAHAQDLGRLAETQGSIGEARTAVLHLA